MGLCLSLIRYFRPWAMPSGHMLRIDIDTKFPRPTHKYTTVTWAGKPKLGWFVIPHVYFLPSFSYLSPLVHILSKALFSLDGGLLEKDLMRKSQSETSFNLREDNHVVQSIRRRRLSHRTENRQRGFFKYLSYISIWIIDADLVSIETQVLKTSQKLQIRIYAVQCPVPFLIVGSHWLSWIQVLNCLKCQLTANSCHVLKVTKVQLIFEGVL